MKITKRKTKSGCTITIKAETAEDKKRLTDSLLSGELLRALNDVGQWPVSMELKQK